MNAYLVYTHYYDFNKIKPTIGGIQTYIYDLGNLLTTKGINVTVLQMGETNKIANYKFMSIKELSVKSGKVRDYLKILPNIIDSLATENDLVIFMTCTLNVALKHKKNISIQHGIYWDIPHVRPKKSIILECLLKYRESFAILRKINLVKNTVAVDYNFLNWYRTQLFFPRIKIKVIPNYAIVNKNMPSFEHKNIRIIFARRFETYRGTRIFAEAIMQVLMKMKNIEVTIAGVGPDAQYLEKKMKNYDNVHFITYNPEESYKVHANQDIAIVPSLGSEGTSLSLIEAMASGCAVIASNVGGMTNIVLNGYNGILIDPTIKEIEQVLETLIINPKLRDRLSQNAIHTVQYSFSKEIWEKRWNDFLDEIINT